jgi:hypothetical protein
MRAFSLAKIGDKYYLENTFGTSISKKSSKTLSPP